MMYSRFITRRIASSSNFSHRGSCHNYSQNKRALSLLSSSSSSSSSLSSERQHTFSIRTFATSKDENETKDNKNNNSEGEKNKDSLRDTINRLKQEKGEEESVDGNPFGTFFGDLSRNPKWNEFQSQVSETWDDLLKAGEAKSINKKLTTMHPHATKEGEEEYTGPVDIMIIDPTENLTTWERMQRRLTDAPIIQDVMNRSGDIYEKSGAKNVKQKVDHVVEDAKEVWETSQNPWIYRMSSVYDTLTAESPESFAVQNLRQLDPEFNLEDWRRDVVEHTLPQIMEWFLKGKINQLKPWLGDGVFKRIAAEITARKQEGVEIDSHVLGIMNSEILACEMDEVSKGNSPIILLHFMCQQINCTRKKKTGEIVEGSEDDIRANSYVAAFQREYDEEHGELNWKIVDFRFNGAIAYI